MKIRYSIFLLVFVLILSTLWPVAPVTAAAYGTKFVTSIAYMNVGTDIATIDLEVYDGSSTPKIIRLNELPKGAASTLYVGSLSGISTGFNGSAIMKSSQPLVTTLLQIPQAPSTVKNRPISNGFSAGSATVTIPTVLKNMWNTNSIFSVQNVDSAAATVTVKFVPLSGSPISQTITLPVGTAKYYDMGKTTPITASSFNGSVVVSALKSGTSEAGAVVATSLESSTANNNTYAFEGVAQGGNKIFMPSAFCNWGEGGLINSAFAVQNISTSQNASVKITYMGGKTDGPYTIGPGAKRSFQGCDVNSNNYIGAATVTSTGGQVVAMGKIGGNGLSTAYVGLTEGYEKIALPYVRWTGQFSGGSRQQVNIAIQNVGSSPIPAGGVTVAFYDGTGGTPKGYTANPSPIAVGGKWSTNAAKINIEFGYQNGGGAIVTGPTGSKLAVIARAATYLTSTTAAGEDYNGIPIN